MSLLALLAAGSGGVPPLPTDLRPAPPDSTIAAMRPAHRRIGQIVVSTDGTGDHTSLAAAASAAHAMQTARMAAEGNPAKTPNYRVDIIVKPGHYTGDFTVPAWTAWYAEDPTRGATTLTHTISGPSPQLGTINTIGGVYWEGIDLIRGVGSPTADPKYPIHASSAGGTSIFARCTLDNAGGSSGGTAYGQDGSNGGYALLYDCDLTPGGTNAHGWADLTIAQTQCYVNCRSAASLAWSDQGSGLADQVWVQDCTATSVATAGPNTVLHLAGTTAGTVTVGGTQDDRTDWPVPVGGLSAFDRARYGIPDPT